MPLGLGGGFARSPRILNGVTSPLYVPGCVAWYRADLGVTTSTGVSAWADQSGSGDSNRNLVQATSTKQPTRNASDAAYNNQATLSFSTGGPTPQSLASPGAWSSSYTTRTICLVGNFDGLGSAEFMVDGLTDSSNVIWNDSGANAVDMYAGTNIGGGTYSSSPLIVIAVFNGASSAIYSSSTGSLATGNCGAGVMAALTVGCNVGGTAGLNGKIAEVFAYDSALTTTQIAVILRYLGARYGLPISLVPDATNWNDNYTYTPSGLYVQRNTMARLRLTTSATSLPVSYAASAATVESNSGISVFSNGALVTTIAPAADTAEHTTTVTLPSGYGKTIDIVDGSQNDPAGTLLGLFVTRVGAGVPDSSTSSLDAKTTPTRRLVVYGDSIAAGFYADTASAHGWAALTRGYYPGQITMDAIGGRSIYYDVATVPGPRATALIAELDGSVTNELWSAIGYNDWSGSLLTAASFASYYGTMLDTVHASAPSAKVWVQTPIPSTHDGTLNAHSETLADFRTAITNMVASRAWATLVDGTSLVSLANLFDGIHPNTTGHAQYAANVRAILGV